MGAEKRRGKARRIICRGPSSVLHQVGASTIDGASCGLDVAGNRTSKTDWLANVTSNYTYDAVYELTEVMQGSNTESYSYDPVGNRLSLSRAMTLRRAAKESE